MPKYDAVGAIPMKYSLVYLGVFMGFWGLAFAVSPFQGMNRADKLYTEKWKQ